jgi:hypothetical protein
VIFRSTSIQVLVAAGVLAAGLTTACAPPTTPARPTISLRMRGRPARASVVIDDEPIGTLDFVAARGVALPVGVHHVSVTAEGFLPWDREIEAREGSPPIRLDVNLVPIPD